MRLIGFTIVGALAFASCSKPVSSETESGPPDASAPAEKTTAAATPAPKPESPQTTAPTTEAKLVTTKAPDGVFYLISVARVETSAGVQNLPVGTGVRLLRPGMYQTPVGEVRLPAEKLTNDMAVARAARDASLAAEVASRPPTPGPQAGAPSTPKPAATPDANHLAAVKSLRLGQLDREIATLKKQFEALQAQENALSLKKSKEDFRRGMKAASSPTNAEQQLTQVQSQMTAVQSKLNSALVERNQIR